MEEAARATRGRRRSLKEGVIQGVNLEASDRFELRRLAKERRTSVSAVIREAVRLYLWGHAGRRMEETHAPQVSDVIVSAGQKAQKPSA